MDYNGAQTADNTSDIGKLIEILNDWEFKYKEEKEASKKGAIPLTPKYADIIKTIGNIGLSVPMGFVMVHNDLTDIYTLLLDMYSSRGASISPTTWQDVAKTALDVAGDSLIAVTAMGLVSKIIDKYSLSDIIDNLERIIDISLEALPKAASSVMKSIDEIGSGVAATILNISDIATYENIIAERKKNSLRYLSAFYSNLFTDLGYEAIFSDDGTEITGIKTYKDERAINLKEVSTGKISGEAVDLVIDKSGDLIGELATAKPKAWIDLFENEVPQAILVGGESYDFLTDENLISQRKVNALRYLNLFFNSMYNPFGYEAVFNEDGTEITKIQKIQKTKISDITDITKSVGIGDAVDFVIDKAGNAVGEFVTAVPEAFINLAEKEIPEAILTGFGVYDAIKDEKIQSVISDMMQYYTQAYFGQLIYSMGWDFDFEKKTLSKRETYEEEKKWWQKNLLELVNDGVEWAGNGLESLMDWSNGIDLKDTMATAIQGLLKTVNENNTVKETANNLMVQYLTAYFSSILTPMGWDLDPESGKVSKTEKEEEKKSWWEKNVIELAEDGIKWIGKGITSFIDWSNDLESNEKIQDIKNNILTNLSNMTIEKGDLTLSSYYNNISSFATKFSEILLDQINNDKNKTDFQLSTSEVKKFRKIALDKFENSSVDFLAEAFSKNYSDSVQSTIEEAVGNYTIEIKDATQTVSSYNESNLFNKLNDILTKLTNIVSALTYEDASNKPVSRLNTLNSINQNLTEGFGTLDLSLDSIEGAVKSLSGSSVNEGNPTVDAMEQM